MQQKHYNVCRQLFKTTTIHLNIYFKIPGMDLDIKLIPLNAAVFVFGLIAYQNIIVIFTGGVGKNGSTVAVRAKNLKNQKRSPSICTLICVK